MSSRDIFQQLAASQTEAELFEATADAAADIIMAARSLEEAAASLVALLQPYTHERRRFHLAGLLSRLAIAAIADADTQQQLTVGLGRVSFIAHAAWPFIDPEEETHGSE